MKAKTIAMNPDTEGAWKALKRAAKAARKLAEATGTPFYVMRKGRIVDLNPGPRKRAKGRA